MVELFKHPHLLLLQAKNCIYKLPGCRLRPGESADEHFLISMISEIPGRGPPYAHGSDPYDMEEIVMSLHEYINHPPALDIVHNGTTFQMIEFYLDEDQSMMKHFPKTF